MLHDEEDEAEMQSPSLSSPTGDLCAAYLLSHRGGARNLGGGGVEEGVEIEEGARREVTESFPPLFAFRRCVPQLTPSPPRASKDSLFQHLGVRCEWLAGNGRFGRFSWAKPNTTLTTMLFNNVGEPS
jgi:hypothetical protein